MAKSWRPNGWDNPYESPDTPYLSEKHILAAIDNPKSFYEMFEAGADAMLEALRELGNSCGGREDNEYRKGTWVFLEEGS